MHEQELIAGLVQFKPLVEEITQLFKSEIKFFIIVVPPIFVNDLLLEFRTSSALQFLLPWSKKHL